MTLCNLALPPSKAARMADLETMKNDWLARIEAAGDLAALEAERVAALGKQGAVTGLLKTPGSYGARRPTLALTILL